jgi:hypothetical protein
MTIHHQTSCTECEALLLNDCPDCEMNKWRILQNALAAFIGIEMIVALTLGVRYFIYVGILSLNYTPTFALNVATNAAIVVFIGLIIIFLLRERITKAMFGFADWYQRTYRTVQEDDDEDEDDE